MNIIKSDVVDFDPKADWRGKSMIDPRNIYGFPYLEEGEPPVITDHPEFRNPRTTAPDENLIAEIREQGEFLQPLALYEFEDKDGPVLIPADGKTRLTAVAREWFENPDTPKFHMVPFVLITGTPDEVRTRMLQYNLDETSVPLTALETAEHLIYLEDVCGISEADQAKLLNKTGRGGIRWIREMKAVAKNKTVAEAVKTGKIDSTTAKEVVKIKDAEGQKKAIQQVEKAKKAGASERQARKTVTAEKSTPRGKTVAAPLTGASKTTLGFKETLSLLTDIYAEAKTALLNGTEAESVNWKDADAVAAYVCEREVLASYRVLVSCLKLGGMKQSEQFDTIESWIKPDELNAMREATPPLPAHRASKKAEATAKAAETKKQEAAPKAKATKPTAKAPASKPKTAPTAKAPAPKAKPSARKGGTVASRK